MEENVNTAAVGQTQPAGEVLPPEQPATTPETGEKEEAFVEVKFNKELKKLSLGEAATLAQKGMKFDLIAEDFEKLRGLSKKEGISVSEYLARRESDAAQKRLAELKEICGGNEELAAKMLELEGPDSKDELEELKAEFPDVTAEGIPEEVKTAAEIKGTGLLFEYLLYEHRQRVAAAEEMSRRKHADSHSLGSLSPSSSQNAADAEFIKGIWGR